MKTTILVLALLGLAVSAWGQTCSGNQDFQGAYMISASRLAPTPAADPLPAGVTPPPEPKYSNTAIGRLVQRARGTGLVAVTGRLVSDGLGNLLGAPPDAEYTTTRLGTYKVNGDCTMTMTVADGFSSNVNFFGDTVQGASVSFQGILQDRGNEANFVQTGQGSDTLLNLQRPQSAQNCNNTTLSGIYGVSAGGIDTGKADAPTFKPISLLGRFVAENGTLKLDTPGLESTQPKRQITGTYKVEADCTGAAKFIIDGKTLDIDFVLVRGGITFGAFQRAEMRFAFQDATSAGVGTAR